MYFILLLFNNLIFALWVFYKDVQKLIHIEGMVEF